MVDPEERKCAIAELLHEEFHGTDEVPCAYDYDLADQLWPS